MNQIGHNIYQIKAKYLGYKVISMLLLWIKMLKKYLLGGGGGVKSAHLVF